MVAGLVIDGVMWVELDAGIVEEEVVAAWLHDINPGEIIIVSEIIPKKTNLCLHKA
jgi:hypothetical protein